MSLRFELGRACPRLGKANEAQKAKEKYEHAGQPSHVDVDVNDPGGLPVVVGTQNPMPEF